MTAQAWAVSEMTMSFCGYKTRTWARKAWKECLHWAKLRGLGPVLSVARMVERHLEGSLNARVLQATNAWVKGSAPVFSGSRTWPVAFGGGNVFARGSCFPWVVWISTLCSSSDHESQSPTEKPEAAIAKRWTSANA